MIVKVFCLVLVLSESLGLVTEFTNYVEDVEGETYGEVHINSEIHRIAKRGINDRQACRATFGADGEELVYRGRTRDVFQVDTYPCLKWMCDDYGGIILLRRHSGCFDSVTDKCVRYQWKNGQKCDQRICRISFQWDGDYKFWKLQYGMVTSWKKHLVTCEHDGKCYNVDSEIYHSNNCTYSKCVILPPKQPRYGRAVQWALSRAGCRVSNVCHMHGARFTQGCDEYLCNATVSTMTSDEEKGRHYHFKTDIKMERTKMGCWKMNNRECIALGETYSPHTCIEYECAMFGKHHQIRLSREGCPQVNGSCLDVGQTSDVRCYQKTCRKTETGHVARFHTIEKKKLGCSNFWMDDDPKCYDVGEKISADNDWSTKLGCTRGAEATCVHLGNDKVQLAIGCKGD